VTRHTLHERHARQAAEAEHPDGEPDYPQDREDAHDNCGVPQPPGATTVARDEDRIVRVQGRLLTLGL
jgi:hypothetical protein